MTNLERVQLVRAVNRVDAKHRAADVRAELVAYLQSLGDFFLFGAGAALDRGHASEGAPRSITVMPKTTRGLGAR